jgi:iron complex transport system permease protein
MTPTDPTAAGRRTRSLSWRLGLLAVGMELAGVVRLCVGTGSGFGWPRTGGLLQAVGRLFTEWFDPARQPVTIMDLRLHRLVTGGTVGLALSSAGVGLQALLRNPLAEPGILGLSAGAGAGVCIQAMIAFHRGQATLGAHHVGALAGALLSMAVVYYASRRRGVLDPLGLLLTGVVLASINASIIMLVNRLVGPGMLREDLAVWMMGYLSETHAPATLLLTLALTLTITAILLRLGPAMDVATFSDAEAASMGVHLGRLRTVLFVASSMLAAAAVVLAGPIAFVGLICPHLARLIVGPAHRPLLLASAMLGIVVILAADMAAIALQHALPRSGLMPVGVFTAMLGGPMFLWMLRPHLGRASNA